MIHQRPQIRILAVLVLIIFGLITRAEAAGIDIKIIPFKKSYFVGETLQGAVNIKNTYPVSLPVIFTMDLKHNGTSQRSRMVHVKTLLPGGMTFNFKTFELPDKPFRKKDIGTWEIIINKLDEDEENAARIEFEVKEKEKDKKR